VTGQTVGHYRVCEKLGEGSSAVVYRAEDLSLGREVVLKFFSHSGAGSVARFQHEARTISSLNHPNICTIYEIGEHEGRHFLAMEMLDGQVLAETIAGRPLSTDRLIDFGTQIADALDAAHAERIVHRDLKPANIFVARPGRIKLLDFGVAVLLPRRADPPAAGRLSSSKGGTIPYMSPEQARVEDLDHRTDLFSLGIILYEMATGGRPFVGGTAAEILSAIVSQPPVAPCELNPALPWELERIITKALEKKPALRYQTASDLGADLQRLKRDLDRANSAQTLRGDHAPSPSPARSSRWWMIAAAIGASVIAGSAWLALAAVKARPDSTGSAGHADVEQAPRRGSDVALRPKTEPLSNPATPIAKPPAAAAQAGRAVLPPARPRVLVAADSSALAANETAPGAAADQFLIARRQIDLKLYDQAIETLQKVAHGGNRPQAIEAAFLIASVHDTRADMANAMSTYIEIATRFADDPRAPEALTRLAESTLRSKGRDREQDARRTLTEVVQKYPGSPWAPRALLIRGDLETREGAYQRDEILGGAVPTAAVTYREISERYPSSDAAPAALHRLAGIYADTKRFAIAAATLEALAARDADGRYDAWFAAGEIYEKRLKDITRARAAYSRVLPSSPHYAEALKRK
jgi:serine/threonine protein kinase